MRDVPPSKAALMRVRARDGRARAGQGAMPCVHAAAPRERMSSSNQIIYLVPLHLVPDSREALAEVGEVRVVLGPRGLDPLDLVADGDDSRGRAGRRPRSHRARGRRPPRSTRRTTTRCPRPRRATSRWSRRPFGGSASMRNFFVRPSLPALSPGPYTSPTDYTSADSLQSFDRRNE